MQPNSTRKLRLEFLESRRLLVADLIDGMLIDHAEVVAFLPAGEFGGGALDPAALFAPTHGGHSTLRRGTDAVNYDLHTTGLPPGAYTVWFAGFNNPAGCIDGCNDEDLFVPEANASVFWSTGGVVGDDGVGNFHGQVNEREVPDGPGQLALGPDGLRVAQTAEIHLILKYHGPASEDAAVLHDQTHTLLGGCLEGANAIDFGAPFGVQCFDPQAVAHKPIELLGDFSDDGVLDATDIDLLSAGVRSGSEDHVLDLNQDGEIDNNDRVFLIDQLMAKPFGDADLDGDVDFADFLALFQAFAGEGGWAQGDFNGSGSVNFDDFLELSSDYGAKVDRAEVVTFFPAGDVGGGALEPHTLFAPMQGGHSTLRRRADSVSYDLHTTGLPPGAYTVWFAAFNNPAGCIDGCNDEDLFVPEANASVFWSNGGVVGNDGVGDFHAQINEGEVPDGPGQIALGPDGLLNAQTAEMHLILKYHGPASEDVAVLYEQTHTLLGGCFEEANAIDFGEPFGVHCFDPQAVAHRL